MSPSSLELVGRVPYAIAAAVPALLIMALVDRLDVGRREPRWLLRRVTLLGAAAVVPVLAVEFALVALGLPVRGHDAGTVVLSSFVVAALPEEAGKAACLAWVMARRIEFDGRTDGVIYGARAGLGFALIESILYALLVEGLRESPLLFAARALLTVPMHATWAGILGYCAAVRHLDGRGPGLAGGLAIAVVGHGLFDFGLGIATLAHARGDRPGFVAAIALVLAVALLGMLAVRRVARLARLRDAEAEAEAEAP